MKVQTSSPVTPVSSAKSTPPERVCDPCFNKNLYEAKKYNARRSDRSNRIVASPTFADAGSKEGLFSKAGDMDGPSSPGSVFEKSNVTAVTQVLRTSFPSPT